MLEAFIGACEGVKKMHGYRLPEVGLTTPGSSGQPKEANQMTMEGGMGEEGIEDETPLIGSNGDAAYPPRPSGEDGDNGKGKNRQVNEMVREEGLEGEEVGKGGDPHPYAHRDIKPA